MSQSKQQPFFRRLKFLPMRQRYLMRFVFRLIIAGLCLYLYIIRPAEFDVLAGWRFFHEFSPLHIVWLIWLGNMLLQLIPTSGLVSSGSQKIFRRHLDPVRPEPETAVLRAAVRDANRAALKVAGVWLVLTSLIGLARQTGWFAQSELFLLIVFFYVADLICVLFWCPFQRLLMKNRCCTTCRIFNWDQIMMMTPALFMTGFYTTSLLMVSIIVLLAWEVTFIRHPNRFLEVSNQVLSCQFCTDHLCYRHPSTEKRDAADRIDDSRNIINQASSK